VAKCNLFVSVHFVLKAHARSLGALSQSHIHGHGLFPLLMNHKHFGAKRVNFYCDGKLFQVNRYVSDDVGAVDQCYVLLIEVVPLSFRD